MMRSFGCLCFAFTLSSHQTKFDPRAILAVFVGYPAGMKGNKMYDIEHQHSFVSQDVVFHEHIYSFHSIVDKDTLNMPFDDVVLP